ncbi:hypothetical protein N7456_007086 [Penicillium angulare]|uniref:RING-CH-type domain-containing protein n=1 Tax=Penicillium angulare TaxID=116970 RepID=A0A9W9FIM6_9EURO|nr:hypothetical protein N7456_006840 [Penicillium angulare]KAJ5101034.1 hypothetical protein N7456_007086 [Penicillium angulare]
MLREIFVGFLRALGRGRNLDERPGEIFINSRAQAESQLAHATTTSMQELNGEDMANQVSYENQSGGVSANSVAPHELNHLTDPLESAASTSTSHIQLGRQGVKVRRLEIGTDVDDIYCIFCLAENGDTIDENVILQCQRCQALSHLGCMEEWLRQCRPESHESCCVWYV